MDLANHQSPRREEAGLVKVLLSPLRAALGALQILSQLVFRMASYDINAPIISVLQIGKLRFRERNLSKITQCLLGLYFDLKQNL